MKVVGVCNCCNIKKEVIEILVEGNNEQKIVLYCKECLREINKLKGEN